MQRATLSGSQTHHGVSIANTGQSPRAGRYTGYITGLVQMLRHGAAETTFQTLIFCNLPACQSHCIDTETYAKKKGPYFLFLVTKIKQFSAGGYRLQSF